MSFFMDPEVTVSTKLVECLYVVIGLICIYCGARNLFDKTNKDNIGTAIFWCALGLVAAFGRWIPNQINGVLILIMCIPAILKRVKPGTSDVPKEEYSKSCAQKIGMKIFIPAFCAGIFSLCFGLFTKISSLVGIFLGVMVGAVILWVYNHDNKPTVFLDDSRRFLDIVGPLCMLPQLLACLGAIFTQAGVGDAVSAIVGKIIPEGNVNIAIIVLGIGMVVFTMLMGNAYAAITVMMVGIGGPFVLAHGADPVLIGSIALTTGYCGTLLTPMAANFNIVPVAVLEMKDRFGVIKKQMLVAFVMIVFQITYMILFK